MTHRITWIGTIATAIIMIVMLIAATREPVRIDSARAEQHAEAIQRGMDLYAFHCAECHGSQGQGEIQEDATDLSDEYMRNQDTDFLYKAIARGRNDTEMAAFFIDEGGALNRQQIESLITTIKAGMWAEVAIRVSELGMISDEELAANQADEQLASAPEIDTETSSEPETGGATVILTAEENYPYDPPGPHITDDMSARKMYKEYCEECHGQQGIGTQDAPELEALNASRIAETVRDGPEDMDVFTHEDIPDRALNKLIDYVLLFHPDSEPRTGTVVTLPTRE